MVNSITLPNNHIALSSQDDMDAILAPLKPFGVTTFSFMRKYPDNTQIYLSNCSGWVKDYYEQALFGQFINKSPEYDKPLYMLFPVESPLPVFQLAKERYNSSNGITFVKPHDSHTDYYFFSGGVTSTHLLNFYLNNIDVLETFILYFHDRAERLISKSKKHKIELPTFETIDAMMKSNSVIAESTLLKNAFRTMRIRKYSFSSPEYKDIKLSARQLDCIIAYNAGLTAKETAQRLNISFRTVEKYFDNIKDKLGCDTKKDIIRVLVSDGFPQQLLYTDC